MDGQTEERERTSVGKTKYKLSKYFKTIVEKNILKAYHPPGCQLLDFGNGAKAPRPEQILATLDAMGIDMGKIQALQKTGYNRYIIYPINNDVPVLTVGSIEVKGMLAAVGEAPPIIREVGPWEIENVTE